MELTTAAAAVAGMKALQSITLDLYAAATGKLKALLKQYTAAKRLDLIYSEIASVRNVKTIWNIDHAVDLLEFYHPTSIRLEDDNNTVVDNLAAFSGNVVIQGTAGQGKSIFLRYLCSRQLLQGHRIPLFQELRRLKQDESLLSALLQRMRMLGFPPDLELFEFLAGEAKLVLLLDGFDEVESTRRRTLVTEIEELAGLYPKMQIIVATRPDMEIIYSRHFAMSSMAYIQRDEVNGVIFTITKGGELADLLIDALARSSGEVMTVLLTPLMITLLIFTYQARRVVPERFSEFYEQLFSILINRHDISKLGLNRDRRCDLSDERMEAVFDALCFLMRKRGLINPTRQALLEVVRHAIIATGEKCGADRYLDDVVRVTNLVLRDGEQYSFIHKSIQEFHSASYIKKIDDEKRSMQFYSEMRNDHWKEWLPELSFLAECDRFRYTKFFLLPEIEEFCVEYLARIPKAWKNIPKTVRMRILRQYTIGWSLEDRHTHHFELNFGEDSWAQNTFLETKHNLLDRLLDSSRRSVIEQRIESERHARLINAHGNPVYVMRIDHAFQAGYLDEVVVVKVLDNLFRDVVNSLFAAQKYLSSTDSNASLISFE